jgi:DNA-binding NtrC family response regulator
MNLVLIVEDDEKIRGSLLMQLRENGYGAHAVASAEEAIEWMEESELEPDLFLADVRLPGMSGIELTRWLAQRGAMPPIIIVSGEASITEAVEALRLGVFDVIEKPFQRERLLKAIHNCLRQVELQREVRLLRRRLDEGETILGRSRAIVELRETIHRVAVTDSRVLVRGESGSGKELVASEIHRSSSRRDKPFVKLNCAAIPVHLIESELFGHVRGAFTDAKVTKPGLFEEADGGTMFLDEIGDMDLTLQARLLRVLEDGTVRRIGETHDRKVDVRLISATHRALEQMIVAREFREDLFFRISNVPIEVPPLRQRRGDVALLFTHFLAEFCARNRRPSMKVSAEALEQIERYRWPGNVRELRNLAERLAVFGSDPITIEQLPSSLFSNEAAPGEIVRLPPTGPIVPLRTFKNESERDYIESVLQRTNWNFSEAARQLEIQRTYLHQKATTLGIRKPGS